MNNSLYAVILAGGSGTRFWPESRRAFPKQFLTLTGNRTMLQTTVDRCLPWIPISQISVIANHSHADEVARQLPDLPPLRIFREPCGRNTGPCIALAAAELLEHDPNAIMAVLPSDHIIQTSDQFRQALEAAATFLHTSPDSLILFGVPPTFPATGYGYIQCDSISPCPGAFRVQSFREKPARKTAESYLREGGYLWNCGIFVWRADRILKALQELQPNIHDCLTELLKTRQLHGWQTAIDSVFPSMPSISIDYAVLEKAHEVVVFEAPFLWDDVGSWLALQRLLGNDADGNTISGLHCGPQTSNCIIRTTDDHLVATMGVDNLIVVHTPDATLIASKESEDSLRSLVEELQRRGLEHYL